VYDEAETQVTNVGLKIRNRKAADRFRSMEKPPGGCKCFLHPPGVFFGRCKLIIAEIKSGHCHGSQIADRIESFRMVTVGGTQTVNQREEVFGLLGPGEKGHLGPGKKDQILAH
jgi:hypothetical protein